MKKIKYLSLLFLLVTLACTEADTETTPTDFVGSWSGELRCPPAPISFNIRLNVRADEARCEACYTAGFSMGGPEETVMATVVNGQLVIDRYIIDEGGSEGAVSIGGSGRLTEAGTMVFEFELEETSGDNFSYTCTSTLNRQ
ncbi:MAG: hypothetical protein Roseis2KO_48180 [Roseivirga sp.]